MLVAVFSVSPAIAVATVMLVALIVYTLLSGADFGAGFWDLIARGPRAAAQRELIAHAIAALLGLWFGYYRDARATAIDPAALILWGCALAQYPLLVPLD